MRVESHPRGASQQSSDGAVDIHPQPIDPIDLARFNLSSAKGLPGNEDLDVDQLIDVLNRWTAQCKAFTEKHAHQYHRDPARFEYRFGYWRMLATTTCLQKHLGVSYNPALIDRDTEWDWRNSRDLFIHGLLTPPHTGTCASIPILIVAIGRRMGYPLRLVRTREHLFARWDEPGGERFNIECHGNGMLCHEDDYYRSWPKPWPDALEALEQKRGSRRVYLRSLNRMEELAECIAQRGHCLAAHGRIEEAIMVYEKAIAWVPDDPLYRSYRDAADPTEAGRPKWYDPEPGVFLEEDPAEFDGGDDNLYRYVGNHPTGLVDPLGLSAQHGTANWSGFAKSVASSLSSFASPLISAGSTIGTVVNTVGSAINASVQNNTPTLADTLDYSLFDTSYTIEAKFPQSLEDKFLLPEFGRDYRSPVEKRVQTLEFFKARKDDPDYPYTTFVEQVPNIYRSNDHHYDQVIELATLINETASIHSAQSPTANRVARDMNVWKTSDLSSRPLISPAQAEETRNQLIYDVYDHTMDKMTSPDGYYVLTMSKEELEMAKWQGVSTIATTLELGAFAVGIGPVASLAKQGTSFALGGFARNRAVSGIGQTLGRGAAVGVYGSGLHEARLGLVEGESFSFDRFQTNAGLIMGADIGLSVLGGFLPKSSVLLPETAAQSEPFVAGASRSIFRGRIGNHGVGFSNPSDASFYNHRYPSLNQAVTTSESNASRWWTGRYSGSAADHNAFWDSGQRVFPTNRNSGLRVPELRDAQTSYTLRRLLSQEAFSESAIYTQAEMSGLQVINNIKLADRGAEKAVRKAIGILEELGIPFWR